jgi:anaerobic selenocysteine-containing dehydrogenase
MGYDEPCFCQSDESVLREFTEAQKHPNFDGISWERLLEEGYVRLNLPQPYLPFAEGNFPTGSGKCEFYSERLKRHGYDPLPLWLPPLSLETAGGVAEDGDGSLFCISPPAHSFLNSTFVNVERLQAREGEPLLWVHPDDARARGLTDGEPVDVHNENGSVQLTCQITTDIMPGTVLAPGVWWSKLSPDGRNINQLTSQEEADMGAGALFYDVRVFVQPALPAPEPSGVVPFPAAIPAD